MKSNAFKAFVVAILIISTAFIGSTLTFTDSTSPSQITPSMIIACTGGHHAPHISAGCGGGGGNGGGDHHAGHEDGCICDHFNRPI